MGDICGQDGEYGDGAWIFDAQDSTNPLAQPFVETPEILDFLNRDSVLSLVAPKGMGKTLALQRKSKLIRDSAVNAIFLPKEELIEKFDRLGIDFKEGALEQYSNPGLWKTLWSTAIATAIIYRSRLKLPIACARALKISDQMSENVDLRSPRTVESFLIQLLNERISSYQDLYTLTLKPILSTLDQYAYVFIDSIDEAFDKHVGYSLLAYRSGTKLYDGSGNRSNDYPAPGGDDDTDDEAAIVTGLYQAGALSEQVWISAQLGLLAAQRDLRNASRRIRVISTLRKEAIDASRSALSLQEMELYQELSCNKVIGQEIFEANIARMRPGRLIAPNAITPIERFFGYTTIEHDEIYDKTGARVAEPIFEYLYRHTLGRPREIVMLGNRLACTDRKPDTVRRVVDEVGYIFYKQYKREMIPYWDNRYNALLKLISTNVISERSAFSSFNRFKTAEPHLDHPFSNFINRGLIGFVRKINNDLQHIAFKPPGAFRTGSFNLGRSSHYFVHPCLELAVRRLNQQFIPDSRQLVGHENAITLGEEGGVFRLTHIGMNQFHFTFDMVDLPRLNNMRSTSAMILACITCAVGRYGLSRVSCEDVSNIARQCTNAGLLLVRQADKVSLDDLIQNYFVPFAELNPDAKSILESLNGALIESHISFGWTRDQHVDDEGFDKDKPPVQWDGSHFNFYICPPEKVDAMFILRRLEEDAESA
ncbi:hypothetical protein [Paraburkholderia acidisoli]|uniref:Uncharacterized protein n=1 Tax=Paraburkholderia acidisoli TaxID=2571748 RepID=A0A7Z2GQR8_9BURK|nr:hypothetical protein [Paraburkholderia acidisoli]QGZ66162.1 hypothetical protein FAZ98_30570 [Paraburkholderia acidisoli]